MFSFNSIYGCQDDNEFLRVFSQREYSELQQDFQYVKDIFNIVNTHNVLYNSFRYLLKDEKKLLDFRYYHSLLSWHFNDCPRVLELEGVEGVEGRRRRRSNDSMDLQQPLKNMLTKNECECRKNMTHPDLKVKPLIEKKFGDMCFNGRILSVEIVKCQNNHVYPFNQDYHSMLNYRYFGSYFSENTTSVHTDTYLPVVSVPGADPNKLEIVLENIACRLRIINYLKIIHGNDFHGMGLKIPKNLLDLTVVDGILHVVICPFVKKTPPNTTTSLDKCSCHLALDNPKGWFNTVFKVFQYRNEMGYAIIKRRMFKKFY